MSDKSYQVGSNCVNFWPLIGTLPLNLYNFVNHCPKDHVYQVIKKMWKVYFGSGELHRSGRLKVHIFDISSETTLPVFLSNFVCLTIRGRVFRAVLSLIIQALYGLWYYDGSIISTIAILRRNGRQCVHACIHAVLHNLWTFYSHDELKVDIVQCKY